MERDGGHGLDGLDTDMGRDEGYGLDGLGIDWVDHGISSWQQAIT